MKNYEEITNELLERRDCYIAEQKRKRKTAMGVITSCCCVCLVALLSFGMWQRGMFRTTPAAVPDDPADTEYAGQVAGNISSTTGKTPGNQVTDHAPNQHLFTINKVQGLAGAEMLDYALKEGVYGEVKTLAEITDYLGRDLSQMESNMPEGFAFIQVRNPANQGWYPKDDSTRPDGLASQSPTYPVHDLPNLSIKLQ